MPKNTKIAVFGTENGNEIRSASTMLYRTSGKIFQRAAGWWPLIWTKSGN